MSMTSLSSVSRVIKHQMTRFRLKKSVEQTHEDICDVIPIHIDRLIGDGLKLIKWCVTLHGRRALPTLVIRGLYESWVRVQIKYSSLSPDLHIAAASVYPSVRMSVEGIIERGTCTEATAFYSAALDAKGSGRLREIEEIRIGVAGFHTYLDTLVVNNERLLRELSRDVSCESTFTYFSPHGWVGQSPPDHELETPLVGGRPETSASAASVSTYIETDNDCIPEGAGTFGQNDWVLHRLSFDV